MAVKITFHGACGIVTGSCFEVRTENSGVLIDCGMFQGTKSIKELNYGPLPFTAESVAALLLTHAHIDHCGLAPKLTNAGFKSPIIATRPTADLLSYVLPDSGYVQETEVQRLNRRNRQRGRHQVEPIYTREDAERCAKHVTPRPLNKWFDVSPDIRARFWDAGHILGSASIELAILDPKFDKTRPMQVLFSGDIGASDNMLENAPQAPSGIDYLVVESTYGDRRRDRASLAQRCAVLRKEIKQALDRGGIVLIPAFAVERTQQLLFDLGRLFNTGQLPEVPVFVDSPLATKTTSVFARHLRLNKDVEVAAPFDRANLHFVEDADESRKLGRVQGGAIIIAGSGMCDAGRIRHHLKNHLSNASATVLLVGYQAPGTLGRLLSQNVAMVRIQEEEVAVKARIRLFEGYSGHADQEDLAKWVRERLPIRQGTFIVHGEEDARSAFSRVLEATGMPRGTLHIPQMGETVRLTAKGAKTERIRARVDVASTAMSDWHNAYADTVIALRRSLDTADEKKRAKILSGVRRAIGASA